MGEHKELTAIRVTAHRVAAPLIRRLGLVDYQSTWHGMQRLVEQRRDDAPDELWLLQHPAVYTQGLNCSMHPLRSNGIPIVHTDRGGQITYHGPGQLIAYAMIDIKRRKMGVKAFVNLLEQAVIGLLNEYGIEGRRKDKAPGVYVEGRKIAALGVRIRRGCTYHGLSLNVDMDLSPFDDIDPCGYEGLEVTQLSSLGVRDSLDTVEDKLSARLVRLFNGTFAAALPTNPGP